MELFEALEVVFSEVKDRLLSEHDQNDESKYKSALYSWIIDDSNIPSKAEDELWLSKVHILFAHLYSESPTHESDYLMHSAQWFCLANVALRQSDYLNALTYLLRAQKNIGPMDGLTSMRRKNANKANEDKLKLKKEAIEYWTANIDPDLSNDKAAAILAKQVPLSMRVLSRYVSEAKKEVKRFQEIQKKHKEYLEQARGE